MKPAQAKGTGQRRPWERKDAPEETPSEKPVDSQEVKTLLTDFIKTNEDFQKKTTDELTELKKNGTVSPETKEALEKMNTHLTAVEKKVKALRLEEKRPSFTNGQGETKELTDEQVEHKQLFNDWFRKGKGEDALDDFEAKALSVGDDTEGGYTVPVVIEDGINTLVRRISNMRRISRVISISGNTYDRQWTFGEAGSGWVGEREERPETSTPNFGKQRFETHEMYANPAITQTLLDDSKIDIEGWLSEEVAFKMAKEEGLAFLSGDGVGKPKGLLSYDMVANDNWEWGKCGFIKSGNATGFDTREPGIQGDALIDLIYGLDQSFRQQAYWLMNDSTVGIIRKFKDNDGNPLWHSRLIDGEPDRILGYGITTVPDMPDVGAGAFPIAFGNFSQAYLIIDRIGTRVLRDPFTRKPYVQFYTTRRVGGGIQDFQAVKFLKIAA